MNSKRLSAGFLALCLLATMVGCSKGTEESVDSSVLQESTNPVQASTDSEADLEADTKADSKMDSEKDAATESTEANSRYYFEPIQGYLYADAVVYTYEASEDTTDEEAALALAKQYMDHLCATPYENGMDDLYKIREYRDLTDFTMLNRLHPYDDITVDADNPPEQDWMELYTDGTDYGVTGLAYLPNMWILRFDFEVQGDGNCRAFAASEWANEYVSGLGITNFNAGVMVKEGNTYYMVMAKDIVSR